MQLATLENRTEKEIMSEASKAFELGLRAEKAGRAQEAVGLYRQSLERDPAYRPSLINLGALLSRIGKLEQAVVLFEKALAIKPDSTIHFNLGSAFFKLKQTEKCKKQLIAALKLDGRLLRAHLLLAYTYSDERNFEKAWIYFKNALKIDRQNPMAILGYAVSLSEAEKYDDALQVIESYAGKEQLPEALKNLRAGLLLKLNRFKESLEVFDKLTVESPKYTSFTDHLADARKTHNANYDAMFSGIDDKIAERTRRLKQKLVKPAAGATAPGSATTEAPVTGDDLKDLVDLSFLHLFKGDSKKAIRFLMQAKKMKEEQEQ